MVAPEWDRCGLRLPRLSPPRWSRAGCRPPSGQPEAGNLARPWRQMPGSTSSALLIFLLCRGLFLKTGRNPPPSHLDAESIIHALWLSNRLSLFQSFACTEGAQCPRFHSRPKGPLPSGAYSGPPGRQCVFTALPTCCYGPGMQTQFKRKCLNRFHKVPPEAKRQLYFRHWNVSTPSHRQRHGVQGGVPSSASFMKKTEVENRPRTATKARGGCGQVVGFRAGCSCFAPRVGEGGVMRTAIHGARRPA